MLFNFPQASPEIHPQQAPYCTHQSRYKLIQPILEMGFPDSLTFIVLPNGPGYRGDIYGHRGIKSGFSGEEKPTSDKLEQHHADKEATLLILFVLRNKRFLSRHCEERLSPPSSLCSFPALCLICGAAKNRQPY